MYNIKYIPPDKDYHNRQKVYFSCHPGDKDLYLDVLAKDILNHNDCVVFYDEKPLEPYIQQDYKDMLLEASLVVIPVTSNFLFRPNRSRDFDFKFATEHFIPVLPVMMEEGLTAAFNEIIGSLQYLDRTSEDRTAINYNQKLKSCLDGIMVDDRLVQQIRTAFDARIFLSYRKKDRAYANRLMQLIHANSLCRDIAIWYDEMLTAGEDFNNSIKNSLESCDLFALSVTENLLESGNYVLTEEFPMAKELGKEIFAAQLQADMTAADKNGFYLAYPGCPQLVDAADRQQLDSALTELAKKLGIEKLKNEPYHRYLMGIAYVEGIDVEKDTAKGLELLTLAANDGLTDAKQKLIAMYELGDGVAADRSKAVLWQESLIDQLEDEYDENPTEQKAMLIVTAMESLCENLNLLMRYSEMAGWAEDMEYYHDIYIKTSPMPQFWQRTKSTALKNFETSFDFAADFEQEEACIIENIAVTKAMFDHSGDYDDLRALAVLEKRYYTVLDSMQRFAEAEAHLSEAQKLFKQLFDERGKVCDRMDYIEILHSTGIFCRQTNKMADAGKHLNMAVLLAEQLVKETDSASAKRLLALSCLNLAMHYYDPVRQLDKAEIFLQKSLELHQEVDAIINSPQSKKEVANAYSALAIIPKHNDKLNTAISIMEQLHAETKLDITAIRLIQLYSSKTTTDILKRKFDGVKEHCDKALALYSSLKSENSVRLVRPSVQRIYHSLAQLAEKEKRFEEALALYEQSVALDGEATVRGYDAISVPEMLRKTSTYNSLMMLCWKFGRFDEAISWEKKLVEVYHLIAKTRKTDQMSWRQYITECETLANMYLDCEMYSEAVVYLEKAKPKYVAMLQHLKEKKQLIPQLPVFCYFYADACEKAGNHTEAKKFFEMAANLQSPQSRQLLEKEKEMSQLRKEDVKNRKSAQKA